jgi:hypothetical protein
MDRLPLLLVTLRASPEVYHQTRALAYDILTLDRVPQGAFGHIGRFSVVLSWEILQVGEFMRSP